MKINIKKAKKLRRKGFSYNEISKVLSISKSTAYNWTKNEYLNKEAKKRIRQLIKKGRIRSKETNKRKYLNLWKKIDRRCDVLKKDKYNKNVYKLVLASLFWSEGEKQNYRLNFINSDPDMIKLYLDILRYCYTINEERFKVIIHLHEYHNRDEIIDFWSKLTGIGKNNFSVYNKPHTGKNKKPGYKGCLSVRYGDNELAKEMFIIIERLKKVNIAGLV